MFEKEMKCLPASVFKKCRPRETGLPIIRTTSPILPYGTISSSKKSSTFQLASFLVLPRRENPSTVIGICDRLLPVSPSPASSRESDSDPSFVMPASGPAYPDRYGIQATESRQSSMTRKHSKEYWLLFRPICASTRYAERASTGGQRPDSGYSKVRAMDTLRSRRISSSATTASRNLPIRKTGDVVIFSSPALSADRASP